MKKIEATLRENLYGFYADKGLNVEVTPEKDESWNIMADLSLEIIIGMANDNPKIPEIIKNAEVKNIQKWFDFVCRNFSDEISKLKEFYKSKTE